jgi:hypothetical protein
MNIKVTVTTPLQSYKFKIGRSSRNHVKVPADKTSF